MFLETGAPTPVFLVSEEVTRTAGPGSPARRSAGRFPGVGLSSCEPLLEGFVASVTGDDDQAIREEPGDRAADLRMTGELPIAVPHRALERQRQFVAAAPPLDIDDLIILLAVEDDRPGSTPGTAATRERDFSEHRTLALKLLRHSLAGRQLASPRIQPS